MQLPMACFNDVHAFCYNSAGSNRIWMKFVALRVHCLELALTDFGAICPEVRAGPRAEISFCLVSNARFHRLHFGQISPDLHTRCGSISPWILSENILENLHVRGPFSKKKSKGAWTSSTTFDFRPRFLRNEYKSWKVITGWHAYECWLSILTGGISSKSFPGL